MFQRQEAAFWQVASRSGHYRNFFSVGSSKEIIDVPGVQINDPLNENNIVLFCSSQQLPGLGLEGNAAFFRWWGVGVFSIIDIF